METRNILKEYEELTAAEKAAVNNIVNDYKHGTSDLDNYTVQHAEEDEIGQTYYTSRNVVGGRNITTEDVMSYMEKFAPHIAEVNERLDSKDRSRNANQNEMRMKLFEDRWKSGYYNKDNQPMNQAPVNVNINNGDSAEVKALKDEVSSLKSDINDLKELLLEKLK